MFISKSKALHDDLISHRRLYNELNLQKPFLQIKLIQHPEIKIAAIK